MMMESSLRLGCRTDFWFGRENIDEPLEKSFGILREKETRGLERRKRSLQIGEIRQVFDR